MNSLSRRTNHLLVQNYLNLNSLRLVNASTTSSDQIRIPNYIPRGKTDILKELASTVKRTPYFMPYGFFSDPHLTPKNSRQHKFFALSKESGIKAAQYFMKNYPELFYRDHAEPKIEKLSYPDVYDDKMEFELDDIWIAIEKRNVSNAIVAFKKLTEEGKEIPSDLKLATFELVCFFNSKDSWEYVEELPFSRNLTLKLVERKNVWEMDGYAEQMWKDIFSKENNIEANSVYLEALVRFGAFDYAYTVYKNFEKDGKDINVEAINAMIKASLFIDFLGPSIETTKKWIDLLNKKSYEPTIETINSLLFSLTTIQSNQNEVIELAQKILKDCKILNLDQTLATYNYIIEIFYNNPNSRDEIIYKIIEKLEQKQIEATCKDDLLFFETALKAASLNLCDVELSIRIFNLFKKHDDFYLNFYRETNTYEYFFNALAKGATTDVLFDYYDNLCPGIFYPSPTLFEYLIDHLIVFRSFGYIERLFTELNKYSYHNLNSLSYKILHLIVSVDRNEKIDNIFADYLFKSMSHFSNLQTRMDHQPSIDKNVKMLNALSEHLCILGKEVEITKFIVQNGEHVQFIEKAYIKKFFSKLFQQLVAGQKVDEAIELLKFVIVKEYGALDDGLIQMVNGANLTNLQKQLIKNLLMLC